MSTVLGTLGNLPNLTIGGQIFINTIPVNGAPIILMAPTGLSSGTYSTFRKLNGTSGYAVTGGKTLTIYGALSLSQATSGAIGIELGYGTSDVGVTTNTSAPTGPVYLLGDASVFAFFVPPNGASLSMALNFTVPAGDFTFVHADSAASHVVTYLYGYEA